jgi:hypothetical protein
VSTLNTSLVRVLHSQYPSFISITSSHPAQRSYNFQNSIDGREFYHKVQRASRAYANATMSSKETLEGYIIDVVLADDRMQFSQIEQIIARVVSEMES